jgi:hypothetical protein
LGTLAKSIWIFSISTPDQLSIKGPFPDIFTLTGRSALVEIPCWTCVFIYCDGRQSATVRLNMCFLIFRDLTLQGPHRKPLSLDWHPPTNVIALIMYHVQHLPSFRCLLSGTGSHEVRRWTKKCAIAAGWTVHLCTHGSV